MSNFLGNIFSSNKKEAETYIEGTSDINETTHPKMRDPEKIAETYKIPTSYINELTNPKMIVPEKAEQREAADTPSNEIIPANEILQDMRKDGTEGEPIQNQLVNRDLNMEGKVILNKPIMLSDKDITELTNVIQSINDENISNEFNKLLDNKPEKDLKTQLNTLNDVSKLITLIQTETDRMNAEFDTTLQPYNRVLELLNRESATTYDEMAWRTFTTKYYNSKYTTNNQANSYDEFMRKTGLNQATPVQKVELYTYYEYDPEIIKYLDLQLYTQETANQIADININKFANKFPIIRLNPTDNKDLLNDLDDNYKFDDNDNLLFMVHDGGLISQQGKDAIWHEVDTRRKENKHTLRFRYVGFGDLGTRLLQRSSSFLNDQNKGYKDMARTMGWIGKGGSKTRKIKRRSKSKTQRKRKSKSKTQRKRKSTRRSKSRKH